MSNTTDRSHPRMRALARTLAAVLVLGAAACGRIGAAENAVLVPPPTVDETASAATSEKAVLAGGCFWGVQGVFQHVKGVSQAISGYTGGAAATAHYEDVGMGTTGHAESVQVTFDPRVVSYGEILRIYFSVAHDPTQKNRQGPDTGTQYRSAIFPMNESQQKVAQAYIAQLDASQDICCAARDDGRARQDVLSAPRTITRISSRTIRPIRTSSSTICRRSIICRSSSRIATTPIPR